MTTRGRTDDAQNAAVETLRAQLADVADRLRRLPESRLNRIAGAARALAQSLADAAAGVEERDGDEPPVVRPVPVTSVFAVADQVAVTAHDLTAAAGVLEPTAAIWWQGARLPLGDVLTILAGQAEQVRAQV